MSLRRPRRPVLWALATIYALLLAASSIVDHRRSRMSAAALDPSDSAVTVRAVRGTSLTPSPVRIVYRECMPSHRTPRATIVLLHGSPGHKADFRRLGPRLAEAFGDRVVAPDLPGFGNSSHDLPDYSFLAESMYVEQLMDRLGVARAHLVAYSLAGGTALHLADRAPARVASITMLSAVGVQEMELLGEYHINRSVHALQLGALWLLREGTPHFGLIGRGVVDYARSFYDADQRPLRAILQRVAMPMLIVHGTADLLVPYEAAMEHARLVPQSELLTVPGGNHLMPFRRTPFLADAIGRFVARAERGEAPVRAQASPARIAAAARPFDPAMLPKAGGITAVVWTGLLAAATFVSEDVTGVTAGILAAQGRLSFALAVAGCFLGIVVGDLLLFAAGRWIGRPIVALPPMRWLIPPAAIDRASEWLARRGAAVVMLSRFTPGMRLPTYIAAGVLRTSVWRFLVWFVAAAAVWTPLLVGAAMLGGRGLLDAAPPLWTVVLAVAAFAIAIRIAVAAATHRGRRLLLSRWRRLTRWEFWPPYVFYVPVAVYILWLMIRHRSATVFTAANPGIPAGGFIGESKHDILMRLSGARDRVARTARIPARLQPAERVRAAHRFIADAGLDFPLVVKPDQGQRGAGVAIVRTAAALEASLAACAFDALVQEYVAGVEFGVFYYRHPSEARGRIFSITDKRFPAVTGDGRRTLEGLILDDDRAVCMARVFADRYRARLWEVPANGERVPLVEIGTHCRGALFLDGRRLHTEALEAAVDAMARCFDGFSFGRFDLRAPDEDRFGAGEFTVVELNGVTSEATHIYDPSNTLVQAWRVLMTQWRIAFEIGAAHARSGAPVTPLRELVRMTRDYRRTARAAPSSAAAAPPRVGEQAEALP